MPVLSSAVLVSALTVSTQAPAPAPAQPAPAQPAPVQPVYPAPPPVAYPPPPPPHPYGNPSGGAAPQGKPGAPVRTPEQRARRMLVGGAVATPLGLLTLGLGVALLVDAKSAGSGRSDRMEIGSFFAVGIGALLTAGGVSALLTGSARLRKLRQAGVTVTRTRHGTWTTGVRLRF